MKWTRRGFLRSSSVIALLSLMARAGLLPSYALADISNRAGFDAKSLDELLKTLGAGKPEQSDQVILTGPEIAENGAVVSLEISSKLANTESIAILIEKNPNTLAASFFVAPGTVPDIQTRVKMAETCDVYALVKANGKFYYAVKEIKVTIGGCGG
ncbi:MAG: thiosulfate oxidation carrier protein SoxY [Betaproteobacteria bacterium]